ncbi:MAG TPA: Hsp20 family protein [Burkholderiales bacterium]|nr:Hsp20 family protein [Burkholderiales bacterium]
MTMRNPTTWMWQEACDLLDEAERRHRQFFRLSAASAGPVWEPPADMFEDEDEFVVIVALPGVAPDRIQVTLESGALVIRAERRMPCPQHAGEIHRLEIPYGYFERSIALPAGPLKAVSRDVADGCLVLRLRKLD